MPPPPHCSRRLSVAAPGSTALLHCPRTGPLPSCNALPPRGGDKSDVSISRGGGGAEPQMAK